MITLPPMKSELNAIQCAVPCMNGQIGTQRVRGCRHRSSISSGVAIGAPPPPAPAIAPKKRSTWRHITPLGMPVVPPVYSR